VLQVWKLIWLVVECSALLNSHSSWPKRRNNKHQQDDCFDFFASMLIAKSTIKEQFILMQHHCHQDYCFHFFDCDHSITAKKLICLIVESIQT
jgi:hypothetical protein